MVNKIESYVQMAGATAAEITKNRENWKSFLATASRLYRYSFPDQLLIHAQRPQATACAGIEIWNKRMRRYVKRGSKGIALVNISNGRPVIRYVFDASDTRIDKDSHNLYLWKYKPEYLDSVAKALEEHFGIPCSGGLAEQLAHIATQLARDYWKNYGMEIMDGAAGSGLEGMEKSDFRKKFCKMVAFSILYILLLRCGLHPEKCLSADIFNGIEDFNSQGMTKILGHAVSEGSGDVLHRIAIAIFSYEREKKDVKQNDSHEKTHDDSGNESENRKQPSSFIISTDKDRQKQPTIREIYDKYKVIVKKFLMSDKAYKNACRNSDRENAFMEGMAAIKRAALLIKDLEFMKLFYDLMEFQNRMEQEVLAETYPELSKVQEKHQGKEEPEAVATKLDSEENAAEEPEAVVTESEKSPESEPESPDTEPDLKDSPAAEPEPDKPDAQPAPNPDVESPSQPAIIIDESEVEELPPAHTASNYRIIDDHLGDGSAKDKYTFNMYAIVMLKNVESEKRAATSGEQEVLAHYVGWGGIPDVFDAGKIDWEKEYQELQSYLTPEEYASARSSVLNAHYTSPVIIKAIYDAIENMGFQSGNILEPSCGIGNFFGCIPEEMSKSKMYGVEIDSISGRIAKLLYPKAKISICGYEKTNFPKNFFDLIIGNVPFGKYQVNDPEYNRLKFSIHNYFFAKSLDHVRPGGILVFITSRYMMDSKDSSVREYIAERADLLGAVRLPRNAFKANAGTEVVCDIVFLQKRSTPAMVQAVWEKAEQNEDGFYVNCYFLCHTEMVLGKQASRSTQYGKPEYTVFPVPDAELANQLHEAVSHIHGKYQEDVSAEPDSKARAVTIPADPEVKNYSFTLVKGDVYYRENSVMTKQKLDATARSRVTGMIHLRDCVRQLIGLQMNENTPDSEIKKKQSELNRMYDAFTCKYGLVNHKANRQAFDKDSAYYLLCSLEILDDDGNLQRKADMFNKRTIKPHKSVTHVDTASEALTVSIGERARVDLPFMTQLTGKAESDLIRELQGVIYMDPIKNTWQTADEYLSGNVRRKLRQAKVAAEQNPAFQINVEALQKAQPKDLEASEIEVRIGATWIDKSYIQQFMYETLNTPINMRSKVRVNYSSATAQWFITSKNTIPYNDVAAYTTYGTDRANAYRILEESLNLCDIRIYDTIEENGKEKRVLNARETTLAAQKQQALRNAFQDWIFKDPKRRQELVLQYNEIMNSTRPREYDGSHIVFTGMNPEITLQPHQVNAIARVLYGGNTLLAHQVGAGKTFELIAAAMEAKRLGLCNKSIFVVPNHLTEQTAAEFLRLYPAANILVTKKKDFETARRKKFCARIATGNYDAVIIGHSQFEKIPLSSERQERLIKEQIDEITDGIREAKSSRDEHFTVKQLEKMKKNLYARLEKLRASYKKDDVITFEQLGVDMMLIDESDNYKNLFLYTKMQNVAGLSTTDAQKSSDMFAKCQYLDGITGGRGIVFATGTPISNSMTEMYVRP